MLLEAGLRGGAVALLVVLAANGLPGTLRTPVGRATILFDLCAIAFLIDTAPGLHDGSFWLATPLRLLSNAAGGVFVAWAEVTFNDVPWPAPWRWAPFAAMLLLAGVAMMSGSVWAWHATHAATLLLVVVGTARVLAGRAADLMEGRRRARLLFACGVGLGIAAITALDAVQVTMLPALSAVLGLAMAAALLRLHAVMPDRAGVAAPTSAMPPAPSSVAAEMPTEERQLAHRLRDAMERDRAYREAGLSVGGLAERLGVPEYRLRQLINQRLGHRNFTEFVNIHRLAEARAALADPAQARVPVLTIALDAGWGSIGPFNRAFKANSGQTPTEFRRQALADPGNLADSESGQARPVPARPDAPSGETGPG